ncbi:MAG: ROK family protein [Candidatus Micrarchaeota archaeon]|nr:ROK family protein [Candidatus Micrarchaeota archaeon]
MLRKEKILGIDIGATKIEWATSNYLKDQKSCKLKINPNISNVKILRLIQKISNDFPNIKKIAIAAAGFIQNNSIKKMPNLKKIKNLKIELKNKEVKIENDLKCAALSQIYKNSLKKSKIKNFLVVGAGTGIGGAIVINNKIYRGEKNLAGEIGHHIIENKEFEKLAAGYNIEKKFKKNYKKMAKYFGIGLANVCNILSPQAVYICGSVGREYLKNKKAKKIFLHYFKKYCINKHIVLRLTFYKNPALGGTYFLFSTHRNFFTSFL